MSTLSRFDLARSAITRLRGRYLVIAFILSISAAVSVFATALGSYGDSQSDSTSSGTSALRQISVYPDQTELSDEVVDQLRSVPHVTAATPLIRTTAMLTETGEDFTLVGVTPDMLPPSLLHETFGFGGNDPNWVVLPAAPEGDGRSQDIGRTIDLVLTKAVDVSAGTNYERQFRVTGTADPTYQVDAPNAAYVELDVAKQVYLTRHGLKASELTYDKVTIQVDSQDNVNAVVSELQGQGVQAVSRLQEVDSVPAIIGLMRLLALIATMALGLLSVLITGLQTLALMRQRTRELGVLRACGWQPGTIVRTWLSEAAIVAGSSVIVGTLLGSAGAILIGSELRQKFGNGILGSVVFGPGWLAPPVLILVTCLLTAAITIRSSARCEIAVLMRKLA